MRKFTIATVLALMATPAWADCTPDKTVCWDGSSTNGNPYPVYSTGRAITCKSGWALVLEEPSMIPKCAAVGDLRDPE